MLRKMLLLGLLSTFLAGCTTTQLTDAESAATSKANLFGYQIKPTGDYGTVIVKRDGGILGSGCRLGFFVKGELAAKIDTGEVAQFYLPTGEHLIGLGAAELTGLCSLSPLTEQTTIINKGETKKFRISGQLGGVFLLSPSSR